MYNKIVSATPVYIASRAIAHGKQGNGSEVLFLPACRAGPIRPAALVLFAISVSLIAGCGSGGGESASTGARS